MLPSSDCLCNVGFKLALFTNGDVSAFAHSSYKEEEEAEEEDPFLNYYYYK